MRAGNISKKFLLTCSAAFVLLCDDACGMQKRFERAESDVDIEAKVVAVVDIAVSGENRSVKLIGDDGLKAPEKDREIYIRYNHRMRGKLKIDSTFEATGSDINNRDVVTYSVHFYSNAKDLDYDRINKNKNESLLRNFPFGTEARLLFKLEDEEKDWTVDTYTGSVKIDITPLE
jgi:hypothetical protein